MMKTLRNTINLKDWTGNSFLYDRSEGMPKFYNSLSISSRILCDWHFARHRFIQYSAVLCLALAGISSVFAYANEPIVFEAKKEIIILWNDTKDSSSRDNRVKLAYDKICLKPNSPLCNYETLERIKVIIDERLDPKAQWFEILLGMTNAESSFGTDYALDNKGGRCEGRNNLWGAKYKINDDNTRVHRSEKFSYYKTIRYTDEFGCNLFPFDSIDEYFISKANGIRFGYKGCLNSPTPLRCISFAYVGNPKKAEQSWINNASILLN